MNTIVKRAGLTQPTFYLYFKGKKIIAELVRLFCT
ncbi:TetR/AcrR family transcriptional regulator [Lentibacillus sp. L22]|nr:TetR/AcrR family transcriptional regulator [Lentibacillus daqui]